MFNKLKQFQELKSQAGQIKTALAEETIEATGAGGQVKIVMDGNQEVKSVEIDDEILQDKERLQVGIAEAINGAVKQVQKVMAQKMASMPGMGM